MKNSFVRVVSRILVVFVVALPFHAQAGLIGTGETGAAAQAARATLAGFIGRAEVAAQLQALGLSPRAATERVAALTDSEVATLAGTIESQPAGADGGAIGLLVVLVFLIWRFKFSDQAKADAAKGDAKK